MSGWAPTPEHAVALRELIAVARRNWPDYDVPSVDLLRHEFTDPTECYRAWGDPGRPHAVMWLYAPKEQGPQTIASAPFVRDEGDVAAWDTAIEWAEGVAGRRAAPLVVSVNGSVGDVELLRRRGYRVGRRFLRMTLSGDALRSLPAPVFEEGIDLVEEGSAVEFAATRTRSFADHDAAQPTTEEEVSAWRRRPGYQPRDHWLALCEGRSVGYLMLEFVGKDGWIDSLGVVPEVRRRGLGRALLRFGNQQLVARGATRLRLSVDADSADRAVDLYEQEGFEVLTVTLRMIRCADVCR